MKAFLCVYRKEGEGVGLLLAQLTLLPARAIFLKLRSDSAIPVLKTGQWFLFVIKTKSKTLSRQFGPDLLSSSAFVSRLSAHPFCIIQAKGFPGSGPLHCLWHLPRSFYLRFTQPMPIASALQVPVLRCPPPERSLPTPSAHHIQASYQNHK